MEIHPSDAKNNDRIVLAKLFKDYGTSNSTVFSTNNGFFNVKAKENAAEKVNFFTFVIHDAEKLTLGAYAALRRTLEKYSSQIKVIMVCNSIGSIIPAIK